MLYLKHFYVTDVSLCYARDKKCGNWLEFLLQRASMQLSSTYETLSSYVQLSRLAATFTQFNRTLTVMTSWQEIGRYTSNSISHCR